MHSLAHLRVVATRQGVDPGFDPVLNHMNYVYTQCQFLKGHFTDDQMVTMVSKFGTYPCSAGLSVLMHYANLASLLPAHGRVLFNPVASSETYRHNKTTCRASGVPCRANIQCCSTACNVATKLCS
jgi:hypothetical protein